MRLCRFHCRWRQFGPMTTRLPRLEWVLALTLACFRRCTYTSATIFLRSEQQCSIIVFTWTTIERISASPIYSPSTSSSFQYGTFGVLPSATDDTSVSTPATYSAASLDTSTTSKSYAWTGGRCQLWGHYTRKCALLSTDTVPASPAYTTRHGISVQRVRHACWILRAVVFKANIAPQTDGRCTPKSHQFCWRLSRSRKFSNVHPS